MPAKSKAQQRLFGMVHAYQKGELDNPSKTIKKIGDNISFKKEKKFASTKHKKLPEKVDESSIKQYMPDAVYIVCDGTTCYGCFGCDIEDEIRDNEVEVVKGPFAQWNDRVDELIEKMNNKMYEGKMATTRLTESQLKKIITESVKKILKENIVSEPTNGFIDCIGKLKIQSGGHGDQRIIDGKVYRFDLRDWKNGYDQLCQEKNDYITTQDYLAWLDANFLIDGMSSEDSLAQYSAYSNEINKAQIEAAHKKQLLKQYRADFENACDDLYYGYGFKFWFNSCSETLSKEDAKIIWKAAIDKMGNDAF